MGGGDDESRFQINSSRGVLLVSHNLRGNNPRVGSFCLIGSREDHRRVDQNHGQAQGYGPPLIRFCWGTDRHNWIKLSRSSAAVATSPIMPSAASISRAGPLLQQDLVPVPAL